MSPLVGVHMLDPGQGAAGEGGGSCGSAVSHQTPEHSRELHTTLRQAHHTR